MVECWRGLKIFPQHSSDRMALQVDVLRADNLWGMRVSGEGMRLTVPVLEGGAGARGEKVVAAGCCGEVQGRP